MGQQRAPEMRPHGPSGRLVYMNASRSSQIRAERSEIPKILISPTSSFSGAVTQTKSKEMGEQPKTAASWPFARLRKLEDH